MLWLLDGYDVSGAEEPPRTPIAQPGAKGLGVYHSYAALTTELEAYAAAFGASQNTNPDLCRLVSLGKSVEDRDIWALKITDKPDKGGLEREFRYIATMHGGERVGTEMCLYFIDMLLTEYGSDSRITNLVDGTEIWIVR